MRCLLCLAAAIMLLGGTAFAQEQPSYEQLKKNYDDALKQLEMAQKRKNELSVENEKLKKDAKEAGDQFAAARAELDKLRSEAREWGERTQAYRAQYAAFREFLRKYPKVWARWELYLQGRLVDEPHQPDLLQADP